MKASSIIGILLIVLGLVGFIFKGITYVSSEEVVDIGPLEVETEQKETIPIGPIASGISLIAGVALLAAGRKK